MASERHSAQFTTPGSKSRPNERSMRVNCQRHDWCFGMNLNTTHEFTVGSMEEEDVPVGRPTCQSLAVQEPHFREKSHLVTRLARDRLSPVASASTDAFHRCFHAPVS